MANLYKKGLQQVTADTRYLKLDASNDPVTNEVDVNPSSDVYSLRLRKQMRIKAGEKVYFDGE